MRRSPAVAFVVIVFAILAIALGFANGVPSAHVADLVVYAVSADGRQLVVTAVVPRACGIERTVGDETPSTVVVTVTLSCSGPRAAGDAPLVDVPVALQTPLGGRTVLDPNGAAVSPKSP